jgi:cytochrome c-type biogenesis protein CcmH/NrfG
MTNQLVQRKKRAAALAAASVAVAVALLALPSPAPAQAPEAAASVDPKVRIGVLRELLAREPKNAPGWVQLGNDYFDTRQFRRAIDAYARALELKPRDPGVLCDQGIMFRALGQTDRAVAAFRKVLELDPKHTVCLLKLAEMSAADRKRSAEATKLLERLLKLDPNGAVGAAARALLEDVRTLAASPPDSADETAARVSILRQLVLHGPENVRAWLQLGHDLRRMELSDDAIDAYAKAFGLAPGHGLGLLDLAEILEGDPATSEAALAGLQELIALAPDGEIGAGARGLRALVDASAAHAAPAEPPPAPASPPAEAGKVQTLLAAVARDPKDVDAWIGLGNEYFDTNLYQPAIDAYAKALALRPGNADVLVDQGLMYRALGRFDQALANYQRAIQVNPRHALAHANLGFLYETDLRDAKKAEAAYERAAKLDPTGRAGIMAGEGLARLRQQKL